MNFKRFSFFLSMGLVLTLPLQASADILKASYSAVFNNLSPGSTSKTFGVSDTYNFNTSFYIDSNAPTIDIILANTGSNPFVTNLYGYSKSALSGVSFTFGTKTWDITDIQTRVFVPFSGGADFYLNAPISSGLATKMSILFSDSDGDLGLNYGSCGFTCDLTTISGATDYSTFRQVSTQSTIFAISPVPEPETYALMLVGLGLIGFATRRQNNLEN